MTEKKCKPRFRPLAWGVKQMVRLICLLAALSLSQVLLFKYISPPATVNMGYEWIRHQLFDSPYTPSAYDWKPIGEISPHLRRTVMASEDQRFLQHNGFDFQEIKAVLKDLVHRQGIRGASTISMQAARSLFLPASRSLARKLAEAWYTVLVEATWDKARILEVYLNTVDWGTGIVGAEAAAQSYFKCSARELTPAQSALLAAILPSPHKWSPVRPSDYILKRRRRIMAQLKLMPLFP